MPKKTDVKAFLFVAGNLKAVEMAAIIIKALSKIVHFVKQHDRLSLPELNAIAA